MLRSVELWLSGGCDNKIYLKQNTNQLSARAQCKRWVSKIKPISSVWTCRASVDSFMDTKTVLASDQRVLYHLYLLSLHITLLRWRISMWHSSGWHMSGWNMSEWHMCAADLKNHKIVRHSAGNALKFPIFRGGSLSRSGSVTQSVCQVVCQVVCHILVIIIKRTSSKPLKWLCIVLKSPAQSCIVLLNPV